MFRLAMYLVAGVSVLSAGTAAGQTSEHTDVHLRNECRLAAQALRTGHPSPHYDWALGAIMNCDITGPSTVISLWQNNLLRNREDLLMLGTMSRAFPLRAVYDVVRGIAESETASTDARVVAISLLASYVAPNAGLTTRDLFDPSTERHPSIVSVSGGNKSLGELADKHDEVVTVLTRIREKTDLFLVRNAAVQYLRILRTNPAER